MATPEAQAKPILHYVYLTGDEPAWDDFPKAPAPGSAVDEDDLLITLAAQGARTDDQKKEALTDEHYSIKLFTGVVDPDFETKYPATYAILKIAGTDAALVTSKLKKLNKRPRPFVGHPTLVTPLFSVEDYSYPSGHSSGSIVQARILASLFPKQTDDLVKRARQVGDSRIVAGVHYASDVAAGQALGDLIYAQLTANPKFAADLAAAAQKDGIPDSAKQVHLMRQL